MQPTRIVLLSHTPDTPSLSLVVSEGRVLERRAMEPHPAEPPEPLRCVLVAPGAQILARWLNLPVRTEAQAGPAAALLLEDQLATPRDRIHLTLGAPTTEGPRLAVVVDPGVLTGWSDQATALGVFPDVIIPDHLTLPEQSDEDLVAVRFGEAYAVRGRELALSCEADLLPLVLGERPWREVADAAEIEAMLMSAAAAPPVNLLNAAASVVAPPSGWRQLRAAAVLLGLLALSPLILSGVNTLRYEAATRRVEVAADARLRTALPAAEPIVNADAQLRTRIERLRASDQFPGAAATLFNALQRANGMELEGLVFEPDKPLRATVSYAAPSDLDLFRAAAQQAGLTVEAAGGAPVEGRLVSDLALSPAR
jgi:general secretion pathway protein L